LGTSLIAELLLRGRRPYSVLMGPMPCQLIRFLPGSFGSLSEVLHRP